MIIFDKFVTRFGINVTKFSFIEYDHSYSGGGAGGGGGSSYHQPSPSYSAAASPGLGKIDGDLKRLVLTEGNLKITEQSRKYNLS